MILFLWEQYHTVRSAAGQQHWRKRKKSQIKNNMTRARIFRHHTVHVPYIWRTDPKYLLDLSFWYHYRRSLQFRSAINDVNYLRCSRQTLTDGWQTSYQGQTVQQTDLGGIIFCCWNNSMFNNYVIQIVENVIFGLFWTLLYFHYTITIQIFISYSPAYCLLQHLLPNFAAGQELLIKY